jgi:fatty-acid desaturase
MNNPVPAPVIPYRLNWTYSITIATVHLIGLAAVMAMAFGPVELRPYLFSWTGVVLLFVGIHLFGQGITIGYHRLLTHRSFQTPKWFEHLLAILGICCMQDTPARWVCIHRMHHVHSDERPDPHSPRVNLFWSHMGWLMFINRDTYSVASLQKFAKDLLRDPFYLKLETNPFRQFVYILMQIPVFFLIGFFIGLFFSGDLLTAVQTGSSVLVWGVILRIIAVWHITWTVNSLSHMFGYQNYKTEEDSRNNWFVALITVGEGWHNNHHEDPSAASVQHRWWELDLSYYEIKLFEKLGLASSVIPIRQHRKVNAEASVSTRSTQEAETSGKAI